MTQVNAIVNLDINTGQASAHLRALQTQINAFQSSLNSANMAHGAMGRQNTQMLSDMTNASRFFTAETMKMRTAASQLDQTLSKGRGTMGQWLGARFAKDGAAASAAMALAHRRAAALQTQFVATGAAANGFQSALAIKPMTAFNSTAAVTNQRLAIQRAMFTQATTSMINFGKNTQWAGRQLMVGFTVPLTMFGVLAGKTFRELEKEVINFKKVYGDAMTTPDELAQNLAAVRKLSAEFTKYGIAAKDTMALAAQAAAAGAQGAELMDATRESTRLATLGQMEQNEALKTTIALQSAFGLSGKELSKSINFLNMVENQTVVTLQDLAAAIPRVAPVIKGLGGTVEDMSAMLAAMQEGGVSAAQGANALKSGLASLINPSKNAVEALNAVGINIKGIIDANRGDLMGTVKGFANALGTLDKFGQQQSLEKLFGKYQYARLGALFANITKAGSQASRVMDIAGLSAEQMAAKANYELNTISDNVATKFTAAMESFKLAIAPIGELFTKFATPIIGFFTSILDKFNNLPDFAKNFIGLATVITGIVIPAGTMLLGLIMNLTGTLLKFGHIVGVSFKGLLTGGIKGALAGISQSLQYMSIAEMEAATAATQLAGASSAVSRALLAQTGAAEAATAPVLELATAYSILATRMAEATAMASVNSPLFVPGQAMAMARTSAPGRLRRAFGGSIPGSGNSDTVPAMLTPGEFVVNKEATAKNLPLLHQINQSKVQHFVRGGRPAAVPNIIIPTAADEAAMLARTQSSALRAVRSQPLMTAEELRAIGIKLDRMHFGEPVKASSTRELELLGLGHFKNGNLRQKSLWGLAERGLPVDILSNDWMNAPYALNQAARRGGPEMALKALPGYMDMTRNQFILGDKKQLIPSRMFALGMPADEIVERMIAEARNPSAVLNGRVARIGRMGEELVDDAFLTQLRNKALPELEGIPEIYSGGRTPTRGDWAAMAGVGIRDPNLDNIVNEMFRSMGIHDYRMGSAMSSKGKPYNVLHTPFGDMKHGSSTGWNKGGLIPGFNDGGGPVFLGNPQSSRETAIALARRAALSRANADMTTGRFSSMPVTSGKRVGDLNSGRSATFIGANGIYEIDGQKYVVKFHDSTDSALVEIRGSHMARGLNGLNTPQQSLVKMPHPMTGDLMPGVASPFDPTFANPTGSIPKSGFGSHLLASVLGRNRDLQPDNMFGMNYPDVGAGGFGVDTNGNPSAMTSRMFGLPNVSARQQLETNLLMTKGGAKRWFAEYTAKFAQEMTGPAYEKMMRAELAKARAALPGVMDSLPYATASERSIYMKQLMGDLDDLDGVNWNEIHAAHASVQPQVAKPPTAAAVAKAAAAKLQKIRTRGRGGFGRFGIPFLNRGGLLKNFELDDSSGTNIYRNKFGSNSGKISTFFGRMQPPTVGHGMMMEQAMFQALKTGGDMSIFTPLFGGKDARSPIPLQQRLASIFEAKGIRANGAANAYTIFDALKLAGYKDVQRIIGANDMGSDSFAKAAKSRGMNSFLMGVDRPDGGVSGTGVRQAAMSGSMEAMRAAGFMGGSPRTAAAIMRSIMLHRNAGGSIYKTGSHPIVPGVGSTDTVPAMLTPGEFVINKRATARNLPLLHALNSGVQKFSGGGMVDGVYGYTADGRAITSLREAKKLQAQGGLFHNAVQGGKRHNAMSDALFAKRVAANAGPPSTMSRFGSYVSSRVMPAVGVWGAGAGLAASQSGPRVAPTNYQRPVNTVPSGGLFDTRQGIHDRNEARRNALANSRYENNMRIAQRNYAERMEQARLARQANYAAGGVSQKYLDMSMEDARREAYKMNKKPGMSRAMMGGVGGAGMALSMASMMPMMMQPNADGSPSKFLGMDSGTASMAMMGGGTALSLLPMLAPIFAPLAALALPVAGVAAALGGLGVAFGVWRKKMDDSARAAADFGSNLGGAANAVGNINKILGKESPADRKRELMLQVAPDDQVKADTFTEQLQTGAGKEFIDSLRSLTSAERFAKLTDYIKAGVASGALESGDAEVFAKSAARELKDTILGVQAAAATKGLSVGSKAMLGLAKQREDAVAANKQVQSVISSNAPDSVDSGSASMAIGGATQIMNDYQNALALAAEEQRNGTLSFEAYLAIVDQTAAATAKWQGVIKQATDNTNDKGATAQGNERALLAGGMEQSQLDALKAIDNDANVLGTNEGWIGGTPTGYHDSEGNARSLESGGYADRRLLAAAQAAGYASPDDWRDNAGDNGLAYDTAATKAASEQDAARALVGARKNEDGDWVEGKTNPLEDAMIGAVRAGMDGTEAASLMQRILEDPLGQAATYFKNAGMTADAFQKSLAAANGQVMQLVSGATSKQTADYTAMTNSLDPDHQQSYAAYIASQGERGGAAVDAFGRIGANMSGVGRKEAQAAFLNTRDNVTGTYGEDIANSLVSSSAMTTALGRTDGRARKRVGEGFDPAAAQSMQRAVDKASEGGVTESVIRYAIDVGGAKSPQEFIDLVNTMTEGTKGVMGLPDEVIKGLHIDMNDPADIARFGAMATSIKQNWPIIENLNPNVDMVAKMQYLLLGKNDKELTPEQVAERTTAINKAMKGLESEDKEVQKKAVLTLITSTQTSDGKTLDSEDAQNVYDDLVGEYGIQKITNLPTDQFNKVIQLGVDVIGAKKFLATLAAAKSLSGIGGSPDAIERQAAAAQRLVAASEMAIDTTVTNPANSTGSTGGGGGGGGEKKLNIGQELKKQLKELVKTFEALKDLGVDQTEKVKGFIAGPFAPQFIEYLKSQGEAGIKMLKNQGEKFQKAYADFMKIQHQTAKNYMQTLPASILQQRQTAQGSEKLRRRLMGMGVEGDSANSIIEGLPEGEMAAYQQALATKPKNRTPEQKELIQRYSPKGLRRIARQQGRLDSENFRRAANEQVGTAARDAKVITRLQGMGYGEEMVSALSQLPGIWQMGNKEIAAYAASLKDTLSLDLRNQANTALDTQLRDAETLAKLRGMGYTDNMVEQLSQLPGIWDMTNAEIKDYAKQLQHIMSLDPAARAQELRDVTMQINDLNREIATIDRVDPLQKELDNLSLINEAYSRKIDLKTRELEKFDDAMDKIEEERDAINKAYDERVKALEKVENVNQRIAQQQQAQLNIASALSRGDVAAAAEAMLQAQQQQAQDRLQDTKDAIEQGRENELLVKENAINGLKEQRKVIEDAIKALQAEQLVNQDLMYDKQLKLNVITAELAAAYDNSALRRQQLIADLERAIALQSEYNRLLSNPSTSAQAVPATPAFDNSYFGYDVTQGPTPQQEAALNASWDNWGGIGPIDFGAAFRFAKGGWVPGTGNKDTTRLMAMPGEFIVNKPAAAAFGPLLEAINSNVFPKVNLGSVTPKVDAGMSGVQYNYGDIHVAITEPGASADDIANAIAYKFQRVADRQIKGVKV